MAKTIRLSDANHKRLVRICLKSQTLDEAVDMLITEHEQKEKKK